MTPGDLRFPFKQPLARMLPASSTDTAVPQPPGKANGPFQLEPFEVQYSATPLNSPTATVPLVLIPWSALPVAPICASVQLPAPLGVHTAARLLLIPTATPDPLT